MKQKDDFNKEKYLKDISTTVTNEIFDIVQEEARMHGDALAETLALDLIKSIVLVMVYNALTNINIPENSTEKEIEEITKLSFATMKDNIQNAIADGFESATSQYSGQNMGYYCKIMTAGPAVNQVPI